MPEIAEVARIVHHLKKSLVGKTLKSVIAQDDANVFGKVGTSSAEIQKSLTGKKVIDAGQQGKYFWLIMSSPPHPVMHFGMTGWFYIRGDPSMHYRPKATDEVELWPPKYWKFALETEEEPKVEAAFTDARRFARVRLVDCAADDIRKTTPLKENGPDPVIDKHLLTEEWLAAKMNSKHVPVKALLLDQANISGIGNWVGDEILYHARLHPEQYSDTFSAAQLKQLHTSIRYVCQTAVDFLADSSKFPDEWLFNHRWGKGKKDAATTLPNGEKITFLTVGGRTSCVVPSLQKKIGAVAGEVKKKDATFAVDGEHGIKPPKSKRRAVKEAQVTLQIKDEPLEEPSTKKSTKKSRAADTTSGSKSTVSKLSKIAGDIEVKPELGLASTNARGRKRGPEDTDILAKQGSKTKKSKGSSLDNAQTTPKVESVGRRRSNRVSKT